MLEMPEPELLQVVLDRKWSLWDRKWWKTVFSEFQNIIQELYADILVKRLHLNYTNDKKSDEMLKIIKSLQKTNEREKEDILYSHDQFIRNHDHIVYES